MSGDAPRWIPVWAMPNLVLAEPIETSHVVLVDSRDERLRELGRQHPALTRFLSAFHDEFGTPICPAVAMYRGDAPRRVQDVAALGGFRDAICMSAIVAGHSLTLKSAGPRGILYADAFDVYPWFLSRHLDDRIIASTPATLSLHTVESLHPQLTPGLGNRSLTRSIIDRPLLDGLLERWERCFAARTNQVETRKNLRLFRALDMARAASKMPGKADKTHYDDGRAVAMWVSAFETLADDETWSGLEHVVRLLGRVPWLRQELRAQDREVLVSNREGNKIKVPTNAAGKLYERLYRLRNDFIHGNSFTSKKLKLKSRKSVLFFASPLFRLALTAFLELDFSQTEAADDENRRWKVVWLRQPQRNAEAAVLMAEQVPDGQE